jgi:hypothetical protein
MKCIHASTTTPMENLTDQIDAALWMDMIMPSVPYVRTAAEQLVIGRR